MKKRKANASSQPSTQVAIPSPSAVSEDESTISDHSHILTQDLESDAVTISQVIPNGQGDMTSETASPTALFPPRAQHQTSPSP